MQKGAKSNDGPTLTQISISDVSPREAETQEMIDLLEKVLDFEDNQLYLTRDVRGGVGALVHFNSFCER